MFWKLVLTIAIVLLVVGRTSVLRNPIVRLVLPRSWQTALSLLPSSAPPPRREPPSRREATPTTETPTGSQPRRWLDGKIRLILFVLFLLGIAAWMATRAMIMMETDAGATLPPP
ncbi:hypothetical protein [Tautonia marina]|uniref:hypothetical protein n=1 Tax=Tautonia marina TaxID=2653855 RepID=UPI00126065B6|nr:hypothetical protein [Tautonia marina]